MVVASSLGTLKKLVAFALSQPGCLEMFSLGSAVARAPAIGKVPPATVQLDAKQV